VKIVDEDVDEAEDETVFLREPVPYPMGDPKFVLLEAPFWTPVPYGAEYPFGGRPVPTGTDPVPVAPVPYGAEYPFGGKPVPTEPLPVPVLIGKVEDEMAVPFAGLPVGFTLYQYNVVRVGCYLNLPFQKQNWSLNLTFQRW
jgi:hypothetical protein